MAKAPKRSGWAAFFGWSPVRAACTFLGHVGLALVCMFGIWVLERVSGLLFQGHEPKFFEWVPIKWFFDAGEAGILLMFVIRGIYDAWGELTR
jgi:hypothetical protein